MIVTCQNYPWLLKSKAIKFVDKSVKSVGARVTNIANHMKQSMTLLEFREYLKNYVIKTHGIETIYEFNEKRFKRKLIK